MLRKTITYQDLDGNPVTEDFYFNLTKAEIAEMELSEAGGFSEYLARIVRESAKNPGIVVQTFKDILRKSYGQRSTDNRRFVKSDALSEEFFQTDAYTVLFLELITDAEASAKFIRGIVPADITQELTEKLNDEPPRPRPVQEVLLPADNTVVPAWITEDREPTQAELTEMSKEELLEVMRRGSGPTLRLRTQPE